MDKAIPGHFENDSPSTVVESMVDIVMGWFSSIHCSMVKIGGRHLAGPIGPVGRDLKWIDETR